MPEEKKQAAAVQVKTKTAPQEKVEVPVEFSSMNKSINIMKDGDRVTIVLNPTIAEEIGAYRRCNVHVVFTENGSVQVIPQI